MTHTHSSRVVVAYDAVWKLARQKLKKNRDRWNLPSLNLFRPIELYYVRVIANQLWTNNELHVCMLDLPEFSTSSLMWALLRRSSRVRYIAKPCMMHLARGRIMRAWNPPCRSHLDEDERDDDDDRHELRCLAWSLSFGRRRRQRRHRKRKEKKSWIWVILQLYTFHSLTVLSLSITLFLFLSCVERRGRMYV